MEKQARRTDPGPTSAALLFAELEERKRRRLFLPKLLAKRAEDMALAGPGRDAAQAMVVKWADMEQAGRLDQKETALDAAFLAEVFGQALGYRGETENAGRWERQRNYYVPTVGTADGALGLFLPNAPLVPSVVIELKGIHTDLDRDKVNGRTAVEQVWGYLLALPETCQWAIVSNFSTIRLYHRGKGTQPYELFKLQDLRDPKRFAEFYWVFEKGGLVNGAMNAPPRALQLLADSARRQVQVGEELYGHYSTHRRELIRHLHRGLGQPLPEAIRVAQKLFDRIIFMAFCRDRGLLPRNILDRAYDPGFLPSETNPRWRNFLRLFAAIDKGNPAGDIPGFNGGLFSRDADPAVNRLDLPDHPGQEVFRAITRYEFEHEVSVTVLGHLFERSINELEQIRETGVYGEALPCDGEPMMPKSAERKRSGTYYTPPDFTTAIVRYTVDELVAGRLAALREAHHLTEEDLANPEPTAANLAYWRAALALLRETKIVDPACGSGAFLIQAYDAMHGHYEHVVAELAHQLDPDAAALAAAVPDMILADNLFGVDLAPEAVEITQLSLWIASARCGKTLANLSRNIVCGNTLVSDPAVHPAAFHWRQRFAEVFNRPGDRAGFDCVIGNPPWERMKVQEREFFALSAPDIAGAVNAATRRKLIAALEAKNPELYQRYQQSLATADKTLAHVRACGEYPLTGQGDINTYMLFAELAQKIVAPAGRVGLLVPSGISTDKTTADFFNALMDRQGLISLHDFENKKPYFPDVHRAFKFTVLVMGGAAVKTPAADFVFFAHDMRDLVDKDRHIELSAADMGRMNPNTHTCPVFRTRRDALLTKAIYGRVPVLVEQDAKERREPVGDSFQRMFDQTNAAELFQEPAKLKEQGYKLVGNCWKKGKWLMLPLYEAKMVQAFDHRAAGVEVKAANWFRQGQTARTVLVDHQNPEFSVMPRYWCADGEVARRLGDDPPPCLLAYKNVTSPTNSRSMIAAFIPACGVINSAPIMRVGSGITPRSQCCLLANLNGFILDYIARQKIGNVNLNFFIVEQLPMFPPDAYAEKCPWSKRETLEHWISERVLKLTCTAHDLRPLAQACDFAAPDYWHPWKDAERAHLRAELDAAYFHLYGITRDDAGYILTTFAGTRSDQSGGPLLGGDAPDAAEPGPAEAVDLADAGTAILEAYDALA